MLSLGHNLPAGGIRPREVDRAGPRLESARGAGSWTGHRLAALIHMHMFDADPVSAALNLTHPCERRIEPFSTLARPRS